MPCGGDSSENCGGPDAIQLYVSESFTGSLGWNNVAVLGYVMHVYFVERPLLRYI